MSKSKFVLLSAVNIGKLIDKAVKTTKQGLELIHQAEIQCLAHAEKHGDTTLLTRLVTEVRDNCKGVVVAGLNKHIQDNSPIRLSVDPETKEVKAKILKEGDPGFKPFDIQTAEATPAMEAREVTDRTNREIRPMSIAELKGMMKRIAERAVKSEKFLGETEEAQALEKSRVEAYSKRLVLMMDNISIEVPKADTVEQVRGEPNRISAKGKAKAEGKSKAAA
jgi:hypothetical protein